MEDKKIVHYGILNPMKEGQNIELNKEDEKLNIPVNSPNSNSISIEELKKKNELLKLEIANLRKQKKELNSPTKKINQFPVQITPTNTDATITDKKFVRLDNSYNLNTKYGRKKSRQQAMYNYYHMSAEDKLELSPYILLIIGFVLALVYAMIWLSDKVAGS